MATSKMLNNLEPEGRNGPGVYVLQNHDTQEFYIGSANNLRVRMQHHEYLLKKGMHGNRNLQQAYNEHPENWDFIASPTESREAAFSHEQAALDLSQGNPSLLNISSRATGKEIVGVSQSAESNAKRSDALLGRPKDETTKQRMRETWQERIESGWKRDPISMQPALNAISKPVVVNGQQYASQNQAAIAHGVTIRTVANRVKSPNFPSWTTVSEE